MNMKMLLIVLLIIIATTACDNKERRADVNTNASPLPTSTASLALSESDVKKALDIIRVRLNTTERGPNIEGMSEGERKRYDVLTKTTPRVPGQSEGYQEQCLYRVIIDRGKLQLSYYKCPYYSYSKFYQEYRSVQADAKDLDASKVNIDNNSISIPCVEGLRNCVDIESGLYGIPTREKSSVFMLKLWNKNPRPDEQLYSRVDPLAEALSKVIKFSQAHPDYKTEEDRKPSYKLQQ